jgi:uncharacterized DUF497 family protein
LRFRFLRDRDTGMPHCLRHGVTEEEVKQAFRDIRENRDGSENSRVAIGHTYGGRILRIIYVPDPKPESVFVITAYELIGKPLRAHRRRQRKKR